MSQEVDNIISGNIEALQKFVVANDKTFVFPNLNYGDRRRSLWNTLFNNLQKDTATPVSLSALRILSRDKSSLNDIITKENFELLLKTANLVLNERDSSTKQDFDIILESLKCLCNIVFNSTNAQQYCSKNTAVKSIMYRVDTENIPYDVRYFDMKLLFLITALNTDTREYLKQELNGVKSLTSSINQILRECKTTTHVGNQDDGFNIPDKYIGLLCEILKILFNITLNNSPSKDWNAEGGYESLVSVLRQLLITPVESVMKQNELQSNVINLLTCVPTESYIALCPEISESDKISKDIIYYDRNMAAINGLLKYLKMKLDLESNAVGQQEVLSPILTTLTRCVRSDRCIRKYVRLNVLPPLDDVHKRPEQGDTLRNHLCRLLTTPCSHVRDLTADFIFVLCKENVARMIKYTGYGNAAGLFATRGLMNGSNQDNQFSSESEDSDTEIYKEYKHGINPVIGCYEKTHPDPTAHMTEEQKEYEALQLVKLMDKLTRSGIIQPCRIGADGRPEPVEHVLQLQDTQRGLQSQQIRNDEDD